MAVAYTNDVHYLDENGVYQTIDNTLVYDSKTGKYQNTDNPDFRVSFGTSASRPGITLQDREGNTLVSATTVSLGAVNTLTDRALQLESPTLTLYNEEKVQVQGTKKDAHKLLTVPENRAEITYQNAYGSGISSQYQIDGMSFKENIVFNYPTSYNAIITRYSMDGLQIETAEDGSLTLYNGQGEAAFTVAAPYMYDAAGAVCPVVSVQAVQAGGDWLVSYLPDAAWRNSAERVYPVVFDPLTTSAVNTNIEDMYSQYINGVYEGVVNDSSLWAGVRVDSSTSKSVFRTFLRPTVYPSVPANNTVVSVELVLSVKNSAGEGYLQLHPITGNADFSANDYSYGSWLNLIDISAIHTQSTYSITLPASEAEDCGNGYIIRDNTDGDNATVSGYVQFYSSNGSSKTDPKIVVTYTPEGLSGKLTTLYNVNDSTYLAVENDTTLSVASDATENALWRFEAVNVGSYRIVSHLYPGKCLGASADGGVSLYNKPSTTADKSLIWYVSVSGSDYYITNEQYAAQLYVDGSTFCIDTGMVTSSDDRKWRMESSAHGVPQTAISILSANGAGLLGEPIEQTSPLSIPNLVHSSVAKDLWRFETTDNNAYRIIFTEEPDKCLATQTGGAVILSTITNDRYDKSQLWYLIDNGNGYSIMSASFSAYLYINGGTCSLSSSVSTDDRRWLLVDHTPEVSKIQNEQTELYLRNETGENYDDAKFITAPYTYLTEVLDKEGNPYDVCLDVCGFRMTYYAEDDAYMIMPISSGNGYQRALTVQSTTATTDNTTELQSCRDGMRDRQLFTIQLNANGKYFIRLKANNALYLVATANGAQASLTNDVNANIEWTFSDYEYKSRPSYTQSFVYSEVEDYYKSFGFGSPFLDVENEEEEYVITSDFGLRYLPGSDVHEGLDFRAAIGTKLTSLAPGKVAYIKTNVNSGAGKYVIIETNVTEYQGTRKVYIIYMHLDEIDVTLNEQVTTQTLIGTSGNSSTNTISAHLHVGIFLANAGLTTQFASNQYWNKYKSNTSTINPLLFMEPEYYANGVNEDIEDPFPQLYP